MSRPKALERWAGAVPAACRPGDDLIGAYAQCTLREVGRAPLGSEEAIFGNLRKLNVRVPATLAVTETLSSGSVSATDKWP